jgi:hypothetical protein
MFKPMLFDTLSPEETCLSWGVMEHWRPGSRYPLHRVLKRRRSTWGDLTAIPELPAELYQPISKR